MGDGKMILECGIVDRWIYIFIYLYVTAGGIYFLNELLHGRNPFGGD